MCGTVYASFLQKLPSLKLFDSVPLRAMRVSDPSTDSEVSTMLTLSVKTQRATVAAALTQTVGRRIHNPGFRRRLLVLEEQRALRCVFHADRGESQPTLWRLESTDRSKNTGNAEFSAT